jgi:Na+/glutamate symporter
MVGVVLPLVYAVVRLFFLREDWLFPNTPEQALFDSAVSGLAATTFGIVIGIPVALWLNRRQQEASDKKEQVAQTREESAHQQKLIGN